MNDDGIADAPTQIETLVSDRAFDGFRPVDRLTFRHRAVSPRGDAADWEAPVTRQMLRSPSIVAVLPYDPATGTLVLLRQFRLGAHLATGNGMLVEIVAGAVDPGEDAPTAARRELAEETGLAATAMRPVARFLSSPGITDELVTLFLARVDATSLPQRAGHDAGEIIYPFACTPAAALAAADGGGIGNVFTLLALNWFDRHKNSLFEPE